MNLTLRIWLILAIIIYFLCLFTLLKRKRLILKYALLWLAAGLGMVVCIIFPNLVAWISTLFGIVDYFNGLFSVLFFFTITIMMSLTSIVSKYREQNRILVQQCGLLEERLRVVENKLNSKNI